MGVKYVFLASTPMSSQMRETSFWACACVPPCVVYLDVSSVYDVQYDECLDA